ncbi:hypothetical protein C8R43DRAFT_347679 [Mycena crocata]|nr:hypothetical protein C8R43DRAFT_347679 [Mycena crocata]
MQASLEPVDIPVRHVAGTFADNVQKAVQTKYSSPNHLDMILGMLLPLLDSAQLEPSDLVHQVVDSVVKYVNNRNSNEAICLVLQDCNLTRVWNRMTARLSTCRSDCLGDVSRAIWTLASLFPGRSPLNARLSTWPNFDGDSLSIFPAAPYSASVMVLLKTHILYAYEAAEIRLHLQALDTQITANEQPSICAPLMTALRDIEGDWALMRAVCALLVPLATIGRPMQLLDSFPTHTIQTIQAYRDWRLRAGAAVREALDLIPRLERRMEEGRLAIVIEFMQACCDRSDNPTLPYRALETFSYHLLPPLWITRPTHRDNQKNFSIALRSLSETPDITPDHLDLLQAIIGSNLFTDELPWLDDTQALSTIKEVLQTHLNVAFVDGGSVVQSRKLEDILNWLESRENQLVPGFLLRHTQSDAGPSRLKQ